MYTSLSFISTQNAPIALFVTIYFFVIALVYGIVLFRDRKKAIKEFNEWLSQQKTIGEQDLADRWG